MMKYRFTFLISLCTLIFSGQLLFASTLEETFKKRMDATEFKMVEIHNTNGNIDITSWDGDEIEIIAYKRVHASNSEKASALMENLIVDIIDEGDVLRIETKRPRKSRGNNGGFFTWLFEGGNSGSSVSYELRVPKEMSLDAHSTNGSITVADCSGKILLTTTNGKIRAEDVSGTVRARSTNGTLNIAMRKVMEDEEMSFKTTNGSIKLYLPYKTNADLEARTTNGRIRCELPLSEMYEKSKRRLEGEINDGGSLIYMKTTNGSISIMEN